MTSSCSSAARWPRSTSFNEPGSPVTLELSADVAAAAETAGAVELVDPEGLPLARVSARRLGGHEPLTHAQFGPSDTSTSPPRRPEQYAGRTFVPVVDALTASQLTPASPTPVRSCCWPWSAPALRTCPPSP